MCSLYSIHLCLFHARPHNQILSPSLWRRGRKESLLMNPPLTCDIVWCYKFSISCWFLMWPYSDELLPFHPLLTFISTLIPWSQAQLNTIYWISTLSLTSCLESLLRVGDGDSKSHCHKVWLESWPSTSRMLHPGLKTWYVSKVNTNPDLLFICPSSMHHCLM